MTKFNVALLTVVISMWYRISNCVLDSTLIEVEACNNELYDTERLLKQSKAMGICFSNDGADKIYICRLRFCIICCTGRGAHSPPISLGTAGSGINSAVVSRRHAPRGGKSFLVG